MQAAKQVSAAIEEQVAEMRSLAVVILDQVAELGPLAAEATEQVPVAEAMPNVEVVRWPLAAAVLCIHSP